MENEKRTVGEHGEKAVSMDAPEKMTGKDHGRRELFDIDFVLDTIPGAVIIYKVHEQGRLEIVSCSRGVKELSGWEADEFCQVNTETNIAAVFPADLDKFNEVMGKMVRTHSRGELIYRGYKKDGTMVWIWFQGHYVGEENGCAIVEAILLDVSNNTNMYQNLTFMEEQKNQQSLILRNLPVGIIVYEIHDKEVRFVEANPTFCEMMVTSKELLLQSKNDDFFKLTHKDDVDACKKILANLSTPGINVNYEFRSYHRQLNKYIWLNGRGRSVLQPNGAVYAYMTYTDITPRKELEEAEHKLLAAQKTAEAKAEFYSRMSHDMRTPMNGILGITELAREEDDIDLLQNDLKKIEESGKYMLNLINDTLDYQRLDSGRTKLHPDVVYAADLVRNMKSMLLNTARGKEIELSIDYEQVDLDWYISVDEMYLKQIVINVVSNAIKFTPQGGKVHIQITNMGVEDMICHERLTVTDTGIGMSREFLENELFKPFSQEKNEVTMNYAGSGLGLSIVKSLLELMNGRIEVDSELGSGTQFTIYLDIERVSRAEAAKHNQKDEKRLHPDIDLSGHRILLCEDHPLNAEIVKRVLEHVHATVDWARDGREGVKLFEQASPGYYAAILMDIRMPNMNGLEATEAIRTLAKPEAQTIPIIAMSANAYEEDIKKSLAAGMNAHLAKPVEAHVVYETLDQFIS